MSLFVGGTGIQEPRSYADTGVSRAAKPVAATTPLPAIREDEHRDSREGYDRYQDQKRRRGRPTTAAHSLAEFSKATQSARVIFVARDTAPSSALELARHGAADLILVVTDDGEVIGSMSLERLRAEIARAPALDHFPDAWIKDVVHLPASAAFSTVANQFQDRDIDAILVWGNRGRLVCVVNRAEFAAAQPERAVDVWA